MSYDEHLISQAGGDGDQLAAIEARRADCQTYNFGMRNANKLAHEDVPALLAMVREQRAVIERVEAVRGELFEFSKDGSLTSGQCAAYRDASRAINAALTATDPS
jgi:hypothetical protein